MILLYENNTHFDHACPSDWAKNSDEIGVPCHGVKYRVLVGEQRLRRVELPDEPPIQHHYPVVVLEAIV